MLSLVIKNFQILKWILNQSRNLKSKLQLFVSVSFFYFPFSKTQTVTSEKLNPSAVLTHRQGGQ